MIMTYINLMNWFKLPMTVFEPWSISHEGLFNTSPWYEDIIGGINVLNSVIHFFELVLSLLFNLHELIISLLHHTTVILR
jgi:hypothetical protein